MRNAIWGTGTNACVFYTNGKHHPIDFFVDGTVDCKKLQLFGRPVLRPDDITDWQNLFFYIPANYFDEISLQLKDKGLKENVNYSVYVNPESISIKKAQDEMMRCLKEIERRQDELKHRVLFIGGIWQKYGYAEYMRSMVRNGIPLAGLSECFWVDPEETEKILKDGWLHTGDIGYIDEDRYLFIVGRKKNVIILPSGENIIPEELEREISEIPDVPDAVPDQGVVRTKEIELTAMTTDEAILQMELLDHSFFAFADSETGSTNIVYKRNNGGYGLLITK